MKRLLSVLWACSLVLVFFTLTATQCHRWGPDSSYLIFADSIRVSGAQAALHQGDTIWLDYHNPSLSFRRTDNRQLQKMDSLSFPFSLTFDASHNSPLDSAGGYCRFLTPFGPDAGLFKNGFASGIMLNFGCNTGGSYDFRIGIVLLKKGYYFISVQGGTLDNCPERVNRLHPFTSNLAFSFNTGNGNEDLLLSMPDSLIALNEKNYDLSAIAAGGLVLVRVE